MNRHWKGLTMFLASGLLVFIVSLMLGSYVLAIASLVGSAIAVSAYAAGEADFRDNPYEHPSRPHHG